MNFKFLRKRAAQLGALKGHSVIVHRIDNDDISVQGKLLLENKSITEKNIILCKLKVGREVASDDMKVIYDALIYLIEKE